MELSEQGRNLVTVVLGGLVVGTISLFVTVNGVPLIGVLLQYNAAVLRGQVWELLTSIVVAPPTFTGVLDVAFNAIALVWLDGFFSLAYSRRQYYAVFVASAFVGNVFSLASGPLAGSFGASGGIFGLLAGVISFDVATNRRLNFALLAWFAGIFVVSSFLFASVDWLAHTGGAAAGLGLGYLVGTGRREER